MNLSDFFIGFGCGAMVAAALIFAALLALVGYKRKAKP